jgi:indole-3-acetate monooxygenase
MNRISHPKHLADETLLTTIWQYAHQAEKLRDLHPSQTQQIYQQNLFKAFVPASLGGLGLTLPEMIRIEEALAWADGSAAWVVTLCSGAGWFSGFLAPSMRQHLANERLCIAGSGASTGTAEETEEGYVITGEWKYASGAWHATLFTANCQIIRNGTQLKNEEGEAVVKSFVLLGEEVDILNTWNTAGMIATGSHSFAVRRLIVPKDRCFEINPKNATLKEPLYQYPFLPLAESTLAVNISGMAQRLIDLVEEVISSRSRKSELTSAMTDILKDATDTLQRLRSSFYSAVDDSWESVINESGTDELMSEVSRTSAELVVASSDIVNKIYPLAGLRAADVSTEINRVWRNFHTAIQHSLFLPALLKKYQTQVQNN